MGDSELLSLLDLVKYCVDNHDTSESTCKVCGDEIAYLEKLEEIARFQSEEINKLKKQKELFLKRVKPKPIMINNELKMYLPEQLNICPRCKSEKPKNIKKCPICNLEVLDEVEK